MPPEIVFVFGPIILLIIIFFVISISEDSEREYVMSESEKINEKRERMYYIWDNYRSYGSYYPQGKGIVPFYEVVDGPFRICFYSEEGELENSDIIPEEFMVNGTFDDMTIRVPGRCQGSYIFYGYEEHQNLINKYRFLQCLPAVILPLEAKDSNRDLRDFQYQDEIDFYAEGAYKNKFQRKEELRRIEIKKLEKEFNGKDQDDKPFYKSFSMSVYEKEW